MFGNNNRNTGYWNTTGQTNNNVSGAFNSLNSSLQGGQQGSSLFGGFGGVNTIGNSSFVNQTPNTTFGTSQNTSLFGQSSQQPTSTGLGGITNTGGLFGQSNQGTMGTSGGFFGQNNQGGGFFGSTLNTGVGTGFGSTMTTGNTVFGSTTGSNTGSMWSTGTGFSTFGGQIQGTEVAGPKHFDGATITHISYEKPTTCKEEFRWEYYKKNNPQLNTGMMQPSTATTGGLFGGSQATSTTGGFFGNVQQSTAGTGFFGSTQPATTGVFGSTQPTTGGLFGNMQSGTTGGMFGATQPTATGSSFLGANQSSAAKGGMFGTTQPTTVGTTGGLFGSAQTTTPQSTNVFGNVQQSAAGTGFFGSNQPATTGVFGSTNTGTTTATGGTGLFGGAASTTPSTGVFGSSTTSAFGGLNKSMFGTPTTTSSAPGTASNAFGSTGLFGSSTPAATATANTAAVGTTGLFGGSTTAGTTGTTTAGTGIFGNTTTSRFNSSTPGFLGSSATTPSTSLFGSTASSGTSNLFGSTTLGGTSTLSSGTMATSGSSLLNTTGSVQQQQQQQQQPGTMRLGHITLHWDVNTPSPGLSSFWSNGTKLPPEAEEYLAKMANTLSKNEGTTTSQTIPQETQATPTVTAVKTSPLENNEDRFGLRKVLIDLGVILPRYNIQNESKYEEISSHDDYRTPRPNTYLKPEEKVEHNIGDSFKKVPKHALSSKLRNYYNQFNTPSGDPFLSLHNGGAKEFDALRFQARGGQLRKNSPKSESSNEEVPYLPSNRVKSISENGSTNTDMDILTMPEDTNKERQRRGTFKLDYDLKTNGDALSQTSKVSDVVIEYTEEADKANPPSVSDGAESRSGFPLLNLRDDEPGQPPILTKEGYNTRPTMSSLRKMSDRQLSSVMDFRIIREGHGEILWPGYTDVRQLNLDKIVDIANRKVTLYGNMSSVHPVGEGLNKNAVITLFNCSPKELDSDGSITKTADHLERLKDHTVSLGCKFISANIKTGQWTFEAPYFVQNDGTEVSQSKTLSYAN